jgi:DNA-binding Lrp family transcriptional regulator
MLSENCSITTEVSMMTDLDAVDARILNALDDDPQATTAALAQRLGLARNTVQAHRRRLESECLAAPSRRLDPARLGYRLLAFVTLEISQGDLDETVEALQNIPEILELHATTGDGDLIARVAAYDPQHLHQVARRMLTSPKVMRTRTTLTLRELIGHRMGPLLDRLTGSAGRPGTRSPASSRSPRG